MQFAHCALKFYVYEESVVQTPVESKNGFVFVAISESVCVRVY